jgi:hypothetical protein
MCLQCTTEAVKILEDVLPGFHLYQAKVDAPEWPAGWYGLVECNDPTIVFPGPLLTDPTFGLSDEQLSAMKDFPDGYDAFTQAADALGEKLVLPALAGYHIIKASMQLGYSDAEHGYLQFWLMHHLASKVAANTPPSAS